VTTCRHCGALFGYDRHPTAAAAGNYYCDDLCRTAHLLGVYHPNVERRRGERRVADRRAS
jgi:hypothetical protein